ncbi:MAG: RodZ domain-containing protein [Nitrospirota bacterium]
MAENTMETLGQYLHRKREERKISIEEVTLHTRILPAFVHAIEEDRFDKIASQVSARGFVRSYLRFLKLDEHEGLSRLTKLLSPSASTSDSSTTFLEAAESEQRFAEGESLGGLSPAKSMDLGSLGDHMRVAPRYYAWLGIFVLCLLSGFLINLFVGNSKNQTNSEAISPTQTGPSAAQEVPVEEPASAANPDTTETVLVPAASETPKPFTLSLEAREPTWVKVSADGKTTKDVLLQTGEKAVWEADATFLLTMGNGGGAEVFLNGKGLGFLGKKGEVIRDRLLTRVAAETPED